jgi:hypothetical protein
MSHQFEQLHSLQLCQWQMSGSVCSDRGYSFEYGRALCDEENDE